MAENVQYTLSLKDLFSAQLAKAKTNTDNFTNSVDGAQTKLSGFGSALKLVAGAAAGLAIGQFIKGSIQAFNEAEKASVQLDATLRSTAGAVGVTREAMDKQAQAMMKVTTYDDDAITGTQALLATFKNIKGEMFTNTIPAIADLATKMGTDLKSATVQVGKAMNDPIKGVAMLGRAGVQFSESQKSMIKSLVETGRLADAQTIVLGELNSQFGGSAAAAAQTYEGRMLILQNRFGNVRESIGGMAVSLLERLTPAIEKTISVIEKSVEWLKENQDIVKGVAISIGIMTAAYIAAQAPLIFATVQTGLWTAAQWLLNAALTANPIGVVIMAIAALAGAIYVAYQRSETFRGAVLGVWEVLKGLFNFVIKAGGGIGTYLEGIFTLDSDKIKKGALQAAQAWKELDISGAFEKGQKSAIQVVAEKSTKSNLKSKTMDGVAGVAPPTDAIGSGGTSAKSIAGQKSTTINVTIGNLVDKFTVQTTNMTESSSKIREMIAATLIGVVNDSQIVATR